MDATKTSLISIATILTATGSAVLATNFWGGVVLLALAIGCLIAREYFKK